MTQRSEQTAFFFEACHQSISLAEDAVDLFRRAAHSLVVHLHDGRVRPPPQFLARLPYPVQLIALEGCSHIWLAGPLSHLETSSLKKVSGQSLVLCSSKIYFS